MPRCMKCRKQQATFHLFDIDGRRKNYCDDCASKKGLDSFLEAQKAKKDRAGKKPVTRQVTPTPRGTASTIDFPVNVDGRVVSIDLSTVRCDKCGVTLAEMFSFTKGACDQCHANFSKKMRALIMQKLEGGASAPIGTKTEPMTFDKLLHSMGAVKSEPTSMGSLKARLQKAIKLEQYEEAAKLRDEIEKLNDKGGQDNAGSNSSRPK